MRRAEHLRRQAAGPRLEGRSFVAAAALLTCLGCRALRCARAPRQAGLTSKIKGKGLQYRGQCDKETGKRLYHKFVGLLRSMSADLVVRYAVLWPCPRRHGTSPRRRGVLSYTVCAVVCKRV